jgi:glycosyltransferase involved in cell wall biosynthesis
LRRSERILVVTQQLGPVRTGVGTYANHLVSGLRDRGFRMRVATFPEGIDTVSGVEFVRLERKRLDPTPGNWYSVARSVTRHIQPGVADLVHFADAREALFYRGDIPAVGTVHDAYALDSPRSPIKLRHYHPDWIRRGGYYATLRRCEAVAYRRLRFLLANSEDTRDKVVRGYGLNPKRTGTFRLGIERPGAVEAVPLDGTPAVLFAGSNYFRKGLHVLIEAAHRTLGNLPGLRLHVAGTDPNRAAIDRLAGRLGVANRIRFHGRVPQDRLLGMMIAADALCMPSRTEGYGLVFLEAMSVGTPVIGSRCGGTRELIRHGENGLLVRPDDAIDLAHQVLRLHRDRRLRDRLVAGGRRAVALHTVDSMIDETLEVYGRFGIRAASSSTSPEPAAPEVAGVVN